MKWMLLFFVFDVSNGGMKLLKQDYIIFGSKASCDAEGRRLETRVEYPGDGIRSMSICVPESAFDE